METETSSMTWEAVAALIEQMEAQRAAEDTARRAAIVPHVRKPLDRTKLSRRAASSPHNRVPIGAGITGTYCGAPITTEDWERREATSKAHAAAADAQVCADCLRSARGGQ